MASSDTVFIPMKLDCFVFNKAVCDGGPKDAKIAPITQPNYTRLRFERQYLASDILPHVDLHSSSPAASNSRFADLGKQEPYPGRQGVYIHWMLPRAFRTAVAETGAQSAHDTKEDVSAAKYPDVPARWLVVRRLNRDTVQPNVELPEYRAWVVESDVLRNIDDLADDVDLQVDIAPYISASTDSDGNASIDMDEQAEVFIGSKTKAEDWVEDLSKPRVPLNVFNSSNQLFADYQPHNGNVFSMVDRFEYMAGDEERVLEHAEASYYVVGWQTDEAKDIWHFETKPDYNRAAQLNKLKMMFHDSDSDEAGKSWNAKPEAARSICHGAMYDVVWDANKKPTNVPADKACEELMSKSPIAVGTTPMDAILAYVSGHVDEPATPESGPPVKPDPDAPIPTREVEKVLLKVLTLLQDRDEGVEPQRRALDALSNLNYKRFDGGKEYFVADVTGRADASHGGQDNKQLSEDDKTTITSLNRRQLRTDTLSRQVQKKQWDLFAAWWKYLTDVQADSKRAEHRQARTEMVEGTDTVKGLGRTIPELSSLLNELSQAAKATAKAQVGVAPPFHQAGDPTVMVAGIASGWPLDYGDTLQVRLRNQIVGAVVDEKEVKVPVLEEHLERVMEQLGKSERFSRFADDVRFLLKEFDLLKDDTGALKVKNGAVLPLYHDLDQQVDRKVTKFRDRWHATQPWFPLFMEWEVEYVHIPWKHWALNNSDAKTSPGAEGKLRYRVTKDSLGEENLDGRRTLSGRVLLLPQPNFSLKSKIAQFFSETPPAVLKNALGENYVDEIKNVIDKELSRLSFLSSPLAGFTNHLVTKLGGTHVKPTYSQPAEDDRPAQLPQAIDGAVAASRDAGYTADDLVRMGLETDLTPYGTSLRFGDDEALPFKPVAHGQFRFTKLNIIDKFGQAIHATTPSVKEKPVPLRPYISEYYAPQRLFSRPAEERDPGRRSTRSKDYEFVQVPPQINQFARLNAHFVKPSADKGGKARFWEPVAQWDNPVWGWMVINYANYGLQFFLPDGRFYREVRLGGPSGSLESPMWLPEKPGSDADTQGARQLQKLVDKLAESQEYLQSFADMVNASMSTMMPPKSAYAEFMGSLIGPPLALVNMGWSLELATEALTTHAVIENKKKIPAMLIRDPKYKNQNIPEDLVYSFKVKLGDGARAYDGLVGYWPSAGKVAEGDAVDFSKLYSYYGPDQSPIVKISNENYPVLEPYFNDPTRKTDPDPDSFFVSHCQELHGFGALIDPFTPVHGYSSILPIKELVLPSWTWQQAFQKMEAFFHLGPIIVTKDVPSKPPPVQEAGQQRVGTQPYKVTVPSLGISKPTWLQPYVAEDADEETPLERAIVYGEYEIVAVDEKMRLEEGPYTALEGYLKVRKPGPDEQ